MENHDENPNCIMKAFEEHPIFIFTEEINNKKQYYFKANDIAKALDIVNIRVSIQNYDDDEVVIRKAYDQKGAMQDTKFLSSNGVYRLLFNSKKPAAKKFRKWASSILDDIIFNESKELHKKLEESNKKIKALEQKHSEEIEQKENERNWLHIVTKNQVNFKKYLVKNDGIYIGAASFEHQNFIEKIGKSVNCKKRQDVFKTPNVTENSFQIYNNYPLYNGMENSTERYIHAILNPFHVNSDSGSTEHFMIHRDFANTIINKIIIEQNGTIKLINDYIDLLHINKFNFDKITSFPNTESSVLNDYTNNTKNTKNCISCNKDLSLNMLIYKLIKKKL